MKLDSVLFSPSFRLSPWILLLCVSISFFSCTRSLHWVHETEQAPSCIPDRLPTWSDYSRQNRHGKKAAITGVNFYPKYSPPKIEMRFDYKRSWVKASIVDPWDPEVVNESRRILLHEQLHFMISCLVTRQANSLLGNGGDPSKMVREVREKARRLHLRYDRETNHGLNPQAQVKWEKDIQQQMLKLSIQHARAS